MLLFTLFLILLIVWSIYMLTKKEYTKFEKKLIIAVYILELLMTIWILYDRYLDSQTPPRHVCSQTHSCECSEDKCKCKYFDENDIEKDVVCPNNQKKVDIK